MTIARFLLALLYTTLWLTFKITSHTIIQAILSHPALSLGYWPAPGGPTVFNIFPGVITGFGEEFGWRGLMFPLMYRIRPWVAFVIGGLIWFGWHVPLTLVMPQPQSLSPLETLANMGILAIASICTFTFLAYVYIKSRSVFVVSVAHIVLNNASRSFSYFVVVQNQLLANLGLAISAAVVIGVLYYLGELRVFRCYFDNTVKTSLGELVT